MKPSTLLLSALGVFFLAGTHGRSLEDRALDGRVINTCDDIPLFSTLHGEITIGSHIDCGGKMKWITATGHSVVRTTPKNEEMSMTDVVWVVESGASITFVARTVTMERSKMMPELQLSLINSRGAVNFQVDGWHKSFEAGYLEDTFGLIKAPDSGGPNENIRFYTNLIVIADPASAPKGDNRPVKRPRLHPDDVRRLKLTPARLGQYDLATVPSSDTTAAASREDDGSKITGEASIPSSVSVLLSDLRQAARTARNDGGGGGGLRTDSSSLLRLKKALGTVRSRGSDNSEETAGPAATTSSNGKAPEPTTKRTQNARRKKIRASATSPNERVDADGTLKTGENLTGRHFRLDSAASEILRVDEDGAVDVPRRVQYVWGIGIHEL